MTTKHDFEHYDASAQSAIDAIHKLKLSACQREVFDLLCRYADRVTHKCEMHAKAYAKIIGCSSRTVYRALEEMQTAKIIDFQQGTKKIRKGAGFISVKVITLLLKGAGYIIKNKTGKKPTESDQSKSAKQTTVKAKETKMSSICDINDNVYKSNSQFSKEQDGNCSNNYYSHNDKSVSSDTKGQEADWKAQSLELFNEIMVALYPRDDEMKEARDHWQRYKLYRYADTILKTILSKQAIWDKTPTQFIVKPLKFLQGQDWRYYTPKDARPIDQNLAIGKAPQVKNPLSQEYYHEQREISGFPSVNYDMGSVSRAYEEYQQECEKEGQAYDALIVETEKTSENLDSHLERSKGSKFGYDIDGQGLNEKIDYFSEEPQSEETLKENHCLIRTEYDRALSRLSELSYELKQANGSFPKTPQETRQWHDKVSFLEQSISQIKSYLKEKQQQISSVLKQGVSFNSNATLLT